MPRRPARPARRPAGEGNVRERRPGYFEAAISLGKLPSGGYDRRYLTGRSREEVLAQLEALRAQRRQGTQRRPRALPKLAVYFPRWLAGKRGTVEARTWRNHERNANLHVLPVLGHLPLDRITTQDLRALYAALQAPPRRLSAKSIRDTHSTLRQALEQALDDCGLARNVARSVRLPKVEKPARRVLSAAQLAALWAAARGHPWYALFRLAAHFPSRSGELRGLAVEDLDLRAGTVTVRRNLQTHGDGGRQIRVKDPKTQAGIRQHEVDDAVLADLAAHLELRARQREAAGPRWVEHGLLFTTRYGTPIAGTNLQRALRRLLAKAGLPPETRVHDLRHTAASSLLAAGVPLPEVAAIAGHAHAGITAALYAHVVKRSRGAAARELAEFYRRGVPDSG